MDRQTKNNTAPPTFAGRGLAAILVIDHQTKPIFKLGGQFKESILYIND